MKTIRQQAYDHIREKLEDGFYLMGERVSEKGLSRELGISTIPVREALAQLISEGFVSKSPGLGSFVPKITREELIELFEIRSLLECYAIGRAAEMITSNQLEELHASFKQQKELVRYFWNKDPISRNFITLDHEQFKTLSETDKEFHLILLEASRSPRVVKLARDLRLMTLVSSGIWYEGEKMDRTRFAYSHLRHYRIMCTVRRGDSKSAKDEMYKHLEFGKDTALGRFDRFAAKEQKKNRRARPPTKAPHFIF